MRTSLPREIGQWCLVGASIAVLSSGCRASMPPRPEDLREGTFAFEMRGVVGSHAVAIDEVVTGTACRANNYILMDNKTMSRRLSLDLPGISATSTEYRLATRGTTNAAHAHLNLPVTVNQGASLHLIDGNSSVVKRSADDVLGTFKGRLAENYIGSGLVPESAFMHGVFRAKRCADWLELARQHESAAVKR
jgi:hypothetical protein